MVGDECPVGRELWEPVLAEAAIRLTDYWEALTLYPGMSPERWEVSDLSTCVGVHHHCNGFMDLKRVADRWNALCCRSCNLRVVVPIDTKTVAQLREWSIVKFCRYNHENEDELAASTRDDE